MNSTSASLVAVLAAAFALPAAAADIPGKFNLDMRLRSETVEQDGFAKDAHALTLRTRLGYETPAWQGFKALVEGENVFALDDSYNSTTNGKTRFPVVSDPEVTELNRAQVAWTGKQADATVGRQRIILANARYVGNAGFRQNEQTYDAVRLGWRPAKSVGFTYAYVDHVRRVFGHNSTQGDWKSDSHILQAEAKTPAGQLIGYGYLLSFDSAPAQSGATWGMRLTGARPVGGGYALTYVAEAARQTDYGASPTDFELGYVELTAGLKHGDQWMTASLEQLDGDGRRGFQTPFATLHAFQGWADVFLTTPAAGVRDLNLRAGTTVKLGGGVPPVRLQGAVHDFRDDDGSTRYGREVDLLAGAAITKTVGVEAKVAIFDGVRPEFSDRTKFWLTLELKI